MSETKLEVKTVGHSEKFWLASEILRSSDEKVMSETKLEVKTVEHSEKFLLTSEIFAKLAKFR